MADVLIISVSDTISFTGRKIRRSCGDRLNARLLIVRNRMGFRFFSLIWDEVSILIETHRNLLVNDQNVTRATFSEHPRRWILLMI